MLPVADRVFIPLPPSPPFLSARAEKEHTHTQRKKETGRRFTRNHARPSFHHTESERDEELPACQSLPPRRPRGVTAGCCESDRMTEQEDDYYPCDYVYAVWRSALDETHREDLLTLYMTGVLTQCIFYLAEYKP